MNTNCNPASADAAKLGQIAHWDSPDADGIVRRTYQTVGHRCPLCAADAFEPRLEDYFLFSGWALGSEIMCDDCGAQFEIVNSDPLELKRLDAAVGEDALPPSRRAS